MVGVTQAATGVPLRFVDEDGDAGHGRLSESDSLCTAARTNTSSAACMSMYMGSGSSEGSNTFAIHSRVVLESFQILWKDGTLERNRRDEINR